MNEKILKKLYENANRYFDMPGFEQFVEDMQDETKLSKFRDSMAEHFEIPELDVFKEDLGFTSLEKKNPNGTGETATTAVGTEEEMEPTGSSAASSQKLGIESIPKGLYGFGKSIRDAVFGSEDIQVPLRPKTAEDIRKENWMKERGFVKKGDNEITFKSSITDEYLKGEEFREDIKYKQTYNLPGESEVFAKDKPKPEDFGLDVRPTDPIGKALYKEALAKWQANNVKGASMADVTRTGDAVREAVEKRNKLVEARDAYLKSGREEDLFINKDGSEVLFRSLEEFDAAIQEQDEIIQVDKEIKEATTEQFQNIEKYKESDEYKVNQEELRQVKEDYLNPLHDASIYLDEEQFVDYFKNTFPDLIEQGWTVTELGAGDRVNIKAPGDRNGLELDLDIGSPDGVLNPNRAINLIASNKPISDILNPNEESEYAVMNRENLRKYIWENSRTIDGEVTLPGELEDLFKEAAIKGDPRARTVMDDMYDFLLFNTASAGNPALKYAMQLATESFSTTTKDEVIEDVIAKEYAGRKDVNVPDLIKRLREGEGDVSPDVMRQINETINKSLNDLAAKQTQVVMQITELDTMEAQLKDFKETELSKFAPDSEDYKYLTKEIAIKEKELEERKRLIDAYTKNNDIYEETLRLQRDINKAAGISFQNRIDRQEKLGTTEGALVNAPLQGIENIFPGLYNWWKSGGSALDMRLKKMLDDTPEEIKKQEWWQEKFEGYEEDFKEKDEQRRKDIEAVDKYWRGSLTSAFGSATTPEYMDSKDRGLFMQAAIGAGRSIPAMIMRVRGVPVGLFGQAFESYSREWLNNPEFENMPLGDLFAVGTVGSLIQAKLENYGLRTMFTKNALGRSLGFNILKSVMNKAVPNMSSQALKRLVNAETSSILANFGIRVLGSGVVELETGALQQVTDLGVKDFYNKWKGQKLWDIPDGFYERLKSVGHAALLEGIGGLLMGGAISAPRIVRQGFTKARVGPQLVDALHFMTNGTESATELQENITSLLKNQIVQGKMTVAQAKSVIENFKVLTSTFRDIPSNINEKTDAFNLLLEKQQLQNSIQGKSKELTKPYRDRITEIDNRLEKLAGDIVVKTRTGVVRENRKETLEREAKEREEREEKVKVLEKQEKRKKTGVLGEKNMVGGFVEETTKKAEEAQKKILVDDNKKREGEVAVYGNQSSKNPQGEIVGYKNLSTGGFRAVEKNKGTTEVVEETPVKEEVTEEVVEETPIEEEVAIPVEYKEKMDVYKGSDLGGGQQAKGTEKNDLVKEAQTEEGKKYVKQEVDKLKKNDDGTITVYRVGNLNEGHNPVTVNKQTAELISKERKQQGLSSQVLETKVMPEDISTVVPGIEGEVFVEITKDNKSRITDNTNTTTESTAIEELQQELEEERKAAAKIEEDGETGKLDKKSWIYKQLPKKKKKVKNLEKQIDKLKTKEDASTKQGPTEVVDEEQTTVGGPVVEGDTKSEVTTRKEDTKVEKEKEVEDAKQETEIKFEALPKEQQNSYIAKAKQQLIEEGSKRPRKTKVVKLAEELYETETYQQEVNKDIDNAIEESLGKKIADKIRELKSTPDGTTKMMFIPPPILNAAIEATARGAGMTADTIGEIVDYIQKKDEWYGNLNETDRKKADADLAKIKKDLKSGKLKAKGVRKDEKVENIITPTEEVELDKIIKVLRAKEFSDRDIKNSLQSKGFKVDDINKAMEVEVEGPKPTTLPKQFERVSKQQGKKLFENVIKKVQKFIESKPAKKGKRKPRKKTDKQILTEAFKILRDDPIFKKQPKQIQDDLVVGLESEIKNQFNIETVPVTFQEKIATLRRNLIQQKAGGIALRNLQIQLKNFIRRNLPKDEGYTQGFVNKMVRKVTELNLDNIERITNEVATEIQKQESRIKKGLLTEIKNYITQQAKGTKTPSNKIKGKSLYFEEKAFFQDAKDVIAAVMSDNFTEQYEKIKDNLFKLLITGKTEAEITKDGSTLESLIEGVREKESELMRRESELIRREEKGEKIKDDEKIKKDEKLTRQERRVLNTLAALDILKNLKQKTLEEQEKVLKDLKDIAAEGRKKYQEKYEQRKKKRDALREKVDEQNRKDNPALFNEEGELYNENERSRAGIKYRIFQTFRNRGWLEGIKKIKEEFPYFEKPRLIIRPLTARTWVRQTDTITNWIDRVTQGRNLYTENITKKLDEAQREEIEGKEKTLSKIDKIAERLGFKNSRAVERGLYPKIEPLAGKTKIEKEDKAELKRIVKNIKKVQKMFNKLKAKTKKSGLDSAKSAVNFKNSINNIVDTLPLGWLKDDVLIHILENNPKVYEQLEDINENNLEEVVKAYDESFTHLQENAGQLYKDNLAAATSYIKTYRFKIKNRQTKTETETKLTKPQLAYIYAVSLHEGNTKMLEEMGFGNAAIGRIRNRILGKDVVKFIDETVDFLSNEYYNEINPVYYSLHNIDLGYRLNYFPLRKISSRQLNNLLANGDFSGVFNAETSPAFKRATDKQADLDISKGFFDMLYSHIDSMERYKAYASRVRDINDFFNIPSVKAVTKELGVDKLLRTLITAQVNPNSAHDAAVGTSEKLYNLALKRFVQLALNVKPAQFFRQASSLIAGFKNFNLTEEQRSKDVSLTDLKSIAKSTGKGLTDIPLYSMYLLKSIFFARSGVKKVYKDSPFLRDRVRKALRGQVTYTEAGPSGLGPQFRNQPTYVGDFVRGFDAAAGATTTLGDLAGVMGYLPTYLRDIDRGMNPEEAIRRFEQYNATQGSRKLTQQNQLQVKANKGGVNMALKPLISFTSVVFNLINETMRTGTNVSRDISRGKAAKPSDIRGFILAGSAVSMAYTAVTHLAKWWFGDDEDEDDFWSEMFKAGTGATLIYNLPFVGAAYENLNLSEKLYSGIKETKKGEESKSNWENFKKGWSEAKKKGFGYSPIQPYLETMKRVKKNRKNYGEIYGTLKTMFELMSGAPLDSPIGIYNFITKDTGGDFNWLDFYDGIGVTKSYRPKAHQEKKKGTSITIEESKGLPEEGDLEKELEVPELSIDELD